MKAIFVNLKSEVTRYKDEFEEMGYQTYRTRMDCSCQAPHNRRSGILAILNNEVLHKIIRCKACANAKAGVSTTLNAQQGKEVYNG